MAKRTVLYYKQNVVVVCYCYRSLRDCIRLKPRFDGELVI